MYEAKNKLNYVNNKSEVHQYVKQLCQMNWAVKNHLALAPNRVWLIFSETQTY